MESSVLSNASHGRSGIVAGRELLKQRIGWLVGSSGNIKVLDDAWLSTSTPTRPIGPPSFSS